MNGRVTFLWLLLGHLVNATTNTTVLRGKRDLPYLPSPTCLKCVQDMRSNTMTLSSAISNAQLAVMSFCVTQNQATQELCDVFMDSFITFTTEVLPMLTPGRADDARYLCTTITHDCYDRSINEEILSTGQISCRYCRKSVIGISVLSQRILKFLTKFAGYLFCRQKTTAQGQIECEEGLDMFAELSNKYHDKFNTNDMYHDICVDIVKCVP